MNTTLKKTFKVRIENVILLTIFLSQNVIPRQYYKDEAFERLILELQSKNTEGYEILAKSENLTIYRRPRGVRNNLNPVFPDCFFSDPTNINFYLVFMTIHLQLPFCQSLNM